MQSIKVKVNPALLQWARNSVGLQIEDVYHKTKINQEDLTAWEKGADYPRLTQLRNLAKLYKKALVFFLLPEPPTKDPHPIPKELRTISSEKGIHFSYKTFLAFNRAHTTQLIAKDLARNVGHSLEHKFNYVTTATNPEELANEYRKKFSLSFQQQKNWRDGYGAFEELRYMIESLGIVVTQSSFPLGEARGFALIENDCPVIVINSKDAINGRIFTLIHEFAHVMLNVNDIFLYNDEDNFIDGHKTVERFCNHFAGAFLVPAKDLLSHPLVKGATKATRWDDLTLNTLSRHFKVSKEAILRRLVTLDLAGQQYYQAKRKEWDEALRGMPKKKGGGRAEPSRDCIKNNGKTIVSLVLDNYRNGFIREADVLAYLNIKPKHLPVVEALVSL